MSLKICAIASGSRGNSYLVKTADTALIIDAGISGKKIFEGLAKADTDIESVQGVLVTHEHGDHSKSIRIVMKKAINATLYSNKETFTRIEDKAPEDRGVVIENGESFMIGDIEVTSFSIHHDAIDPVGYTFKKGGRQLSIVTDTGYICQDIFKEIKDADLLVLEANHEPNMVHMCNYPYSTKRRILGDEGHLSNEAAGNCLSEILEVDQKQRTVLLAHLSQENNTPSNARMTVKSVLLEKNVQIPVDFKMEVLSQNFVSSLYEV